MAQGDALERTVSAPAASPVEHLDRIERGLHNVQRLLRTESRRSAQQLVQLRSALARYTEAGGRGRPHSHRSAAAPTLLDSGACVAVLTATDALVQRTRQLRQTTAVVSIQMELARLWATLVEPWFTVVVEAGFVRPTMARVEHLAARVSGLTRRLRRGHPCSAASPLAACARVIDAHGTRADGEGGGEGAEVVTVMATEGEGREEESTPTLLAHHGCFLRQPRPLARTLRLLLGVVPEAVAALRAEMEEHYGCLYRTARVRDPLQPQPLPHMDEAAVMDGAPEGSMDSLLSLFAGLDESDGEVHVWESALSPSATATLPATTLELLVSYLRRARARAARLRFATAADLAAAAREAAPSALVVPDPMPLLASARQLVSGGATTGEQEEVQAAVRAAASALADGTTRATLFNAAVLAHVRVGGVGLSQARDGNESRPPSVIRGGHGGVLRCMQEKEREWRQRSLESAMAWCERTSTSSTARRLVALPMWSLLQLQEVSAAAVVAQGRGTEGEDGGDAGVAPAQRQLLESLRRRLISDARGPAGGETGRCGLLLPVRAGPRGSGAAPGGEPAAPAAPGPSPLVLPPGFESKLMELYRTCPLLYVVEQRLQARGE